MPGTIARLAGGEKVVADAEVDVADAPPELCVDRGLTSGYEARRVSTRGRSSAIWAWWNTRTAPKQVFLEVVLAVALESVA
jgi:hypothetical protein